LIRRLSPGDSLYPERLVEAGAAPDSLWVSGDFDPSLPAIAVVGSRRPSVYGRRMARRIAAGLASAGAVVVSGLARGIDAEAHEAALSVRGRTWAVLGSGLERVYPAEHAGLARRIAEGGGAVLSQFEPSKGPRKPHFPARNRIVSGLSLAVVVIEGTERSGSLITAREAADQGREVFAVPGLADSPLGQASFLLLRDGAIPVRSADDVLEGLGLGNEAPESPPGLTYKEEGDTLAERKILDCLRSDSLTIEELIGETELELPRLLALLSYMEGKGTIVPVAGQGYARS
jgi:DNA processing protein